MFGQKQYSYVCTFTTNVKLSVEDWAGRGFRILQQITAGGRIRAVRKNPEGGRVIFLVSPSLLHIPEVTSCFSFQ